MAPKNHLSAELREEQWLVIEWPQNAEEPLNYWLSGLCASSTRKQLIKSAKIRWRIEQGYQELKQEFKLK
ncbi:MAG: hypothetical protein HKN43_02940 [Rhodothermales bacterium]|nr:hypothetical protein [Rhodothermales bacterium]